MESYSILTQSAQRASPVFAKYFLTGHVLIINTESYGSEGVIQRFAYRSLLPSTAQYGTRDIKTLVDPERNFVGMNYQKVVKIITSLFVLLVGVILLTNPVLGYSQALPGGVFELTFGGLLLASSLLLYQTGTTTE